jgi:iron complex outermembrane receptor protein
MNNRWITRVFSIAIGTLTFAFAHAQTTPAPLAADAPQAEAAEASVGLEEITVTAQRREENLQRAAVPVDVLSGVDVANKGITSALGLQEVSPSLEVSNSGGSNTSFFVRGVGNFSANAYSDPAIAFNYDGVYEGRPAGTSGVFYDLARIEVLKGPQGTLYGRNATAGAINVIPNIPILGSLSGMADLSVGNYDSVSVQSAINLPIGETIAMRFAGSEVTHSGYLSDGDSDENTHSFRGQVLAAVSDDLRIRLASDYSHTGNHGVGGVYVDSSAYSPAAGTFLYTPSGLGPWNGDLSPSSQAYRETFKSGQVGRTWVPLAQQSIDDTFYGVNAQMDYKTPIGTLTFIPAYRSANQHDVQSSPGFTPNTREMVNQKSYELRLTGDASIFHYVAGLYDFNEHVDGDYIEDQYQLAAYQDFLTTTASYAAFGRLTADVTDRFRLTGGLRYTHEKKTIDGTGPTLLQVCTQAACPDAPFIPPTTPLAQLPFAVPTPGSPPTPVIVNGVYTGAISVLLPEQLNTSTVVHRVTPRLAAEYDLAPQSLLYASYESGFHSGGFSLAAGHETFQPEYIDAYTIGSKNRFLDNSLQVNLEAFLWKYKNQQVAHFGLDANNNPAFYTENVGRSTIKGFEADIAYRVLTNTEIGTTVQYLDSIYNDFAYSVPNFGPENVGCPYGPSPTNKALLLVNCSGKPAFNSPKWTTNLNAQQTIPLDSHKIVVGADTEFRSAQYIAFEYIAPEIAQPNWITNATASFGSQDDRWAVSAYVRNLSDKWVPTSATAFANFVTERPNAPRTYGARILVKF